MRLCTRYLPLIRALPLAAFVLYSQATQASQDLHDALEHRRWTIADEGPSQVGALAQTPDGYLWLGADDSLYRFDGLRFSRYPSPDSEPIGIVSTLHAGVAGLWVGLRMGGVRLVTARGMRTYGTDQGIPEGVVYGIAEDRQGAVWVAANDGLARFDGNAWQRIERDWGFPGHNARAVFVDRDGTLWAANEERLFFLPDGAKGFQDAGVAVGWVNQITQAPDGAIWLVERYSGSLRRVLPGQAEASVQTQVVEGANQLLFDRKGALWIGTTGHGLRHISSPVDAGPALRENPEAFTSKDGLSADSTRPLLEDSEGSLWVGTRTGLDRFRPRRLIAAELPQGAVNLALASGADGGLWVGASNHTAMRLTGSGLEHLAIPAPINAAMTDAEGTVWMAGSTGIWRTKGVHTEHVAALPTQASLDSPVRAMTRDGQGNLWVSINRTGLFLLKDGQWSWQTPPTRQANQIMPVTAATDLQGRLWFGYRDNLIVTRDAQGERLWGDADGLNIGHVTAMLHMPSRTWVAGQRGVAYFDGKRFHGLRLPDNGLFDNIYALLAAPSPLQQEVSREDLWLHSKAGIFQITASELARAFADPAHRVRYRSYETRSGLANDPHQVLPLPTAVRTTDGRLWFSTNRGVAWIDPARTRQNSVTPRIQIESVSVNGKTLPVEAPLELSAQTRRIEISYSALSLSAQEDLHFSYRLDGFDDTWHQVDSRRSVVYTGLGPGEYRFRVMASDQAGVTSAKAAELHFTIAPLFYRTPLFLLVCGALLVAVLWALHLFNMRRVAAQLRARLEARHEERERIARELHDTLLQGVQGLMLSFQAATHLIPPHDQARIKLERALDRADQVLAEGRDRVLDLRQLNPVEPGLDEALGILGRELEQDGNTAFSLSVRGGSLPLHPIVREESYRIGREAIFNAIRHADARNVDITITYAAHAFQLNITDNGQGIDPQYLPPHTRPNHWGLCGMRERAERIGGRLSIRRGTHRGTEIQLTVPALTAYRNMPRRLGLWLRNLTTPRT